MLKEDVSINDLVKKLDTHLHKNHLKNFDLKSYNILNLDKFISFKKGEYTRNILYRSNLYEIILICWSPNSETPIHKHPKNGCLLKVINGILDEKIYYKDKILDRKISQNDIGYLDDTIGTHKIKSQTFTVSLHIYSPSGFYE